ncbi:hypothetical protein [Streptomyces sp. WZ-12]|uniref:hypothetical protein n=1 Tax=Streptomyces sp. WZ-12 TaxID=3030210 RepID=UPI002380EB52|nr:hypothetical protein [Streptomyces sp. WZ-12]
MFHHRLPVFVAGGVGGFPDACEGVEEVGAQEGGEGVFQELGFVRVEDSGVPPGKD